MTSLLYWIRNKSGFYIYQVRGVCFLTWVNDHDKAKAAVFPKDKIEGWLRVVTRMAGEPLEAVERSTSDAPTEPSEQIVQCMRCGADTILPKEHHSGCFVILCDSCFDQFVQTG